MSWFTFSFRCFELDQQRTNNWGLHTKFILFVFQIIITAVEAFTVWVKQHCLKIHIQGIALAPSTIVYGETCVANKPGRRSNTCQTLWQLSFKCLFTFWLLTLSEAFQYTGIWCICVSSIAVCWRVPVHDRWCLWFIFRVWFGRKCCCSDAARERRLDACAHAIWAFSIAQQGRFV